jgi:hypothetical protein
VTVTVSVARQLSRSLSAGAVFLRDKADVRWETIEETPWILNISIAEIRENFSLCGLYSEQR